MKNISKKAEKQKQVFDTVELESGETLELFESATEYNLPAIADKLATGNPLNEIERQMAAGTIRDWLKQTKARSTGGKIGGKKSSPNAGRKPIENPTDAALYQRERRKKLKNAAKILPNK